MSDPTLLLGAAAVKTVLRIWLKDDQAAQQAGFTLTDLVEGRLSDIRQKRRARRLLENLEEKIADQISDFIDREYRGVAINERQAAVYSVTLTLDKAQLSVSDVIAADLNPLYLERAIRRRSNVSTRDLSAGAVELYNTILAQCCAYIVEVSNVLPGFEVDVFSALLSRDAEILELVTQLLDRVTAMSQHGDIDRFENAYRQVVAKKLDRLELYGVTVSDAVRSVPLSATYISLTVNSQQISRRHPSLQRLTSDEGATGSPATEWQNIPIEEALTSTSKLFLRGEAGQGKTTLLQWVAVRAALRDFKGPLAGWNYLIPFFLRLRAFAGRPLPKPEEFLSDIGRNLVGEMPAGWVQRKLRDGAAVVLIDGIDELPESERANAKVWLRDLLDAFPNARYIITSRPAAVSELWLDKEEFDPAEIEPMNWPDVQALIEQWHAVFLSTGNDPEEVALIRESQHRLLSEFRARRHLMQLATNPLLTALLCALSLDRRTLLPRDRMEIYRIALEMLLERRDIERRIQVPDIELSRRDKMLLLQDLAYWLIRNGWTDVSVVRAAERFQQRLSSMPQVNLDGQALVRYLLDRSGIIRRPAVDRIDFIHRTFQEYLAAAAAVDSDDIGVLVEHAHDDQWKQVIIMAAGHALFHQRNDLFRALLDRAETITSGHRRIIQALAIACLETSHRLDVQILERVEAVASQLLPPRTIAAAEALALGGDLIVERLTGQPIRGARQACATVRLASLVGGDQALDLIVECAHVTTQRAMDTELIRAWPSFDSETYGRKVLTGRSIDYARIFDPTLLPALHYPIIDLLSLDFKHGHGDLSDLARLVSVEILSIIDPLVTDLSPLKGMNNLTDVSLEATGLVSLKDLPKERIETLSFDFRNILDREELRSFVSLKNLDIAGAGNESIAIALLAELHIRLKRFSLWDARGIEGLDGLTPLRSLGSLEHLVLFEASHLLNIAGIEKWAKTQDGITLHASRLGDVERLSMLPKLRYVNLRDTPVSDLSFVKGLSSLWSLHLGGTQRLPNLAPLKDSQSLDFLFLYGKDDVDLRPLASMQNLTIYISNRKHRTVRGFNSLGAGIKIVDAGS